MSDEQPKDNRLTLEEFRELFGDEVPIEVVSFVWNAPEGMTMFEIRNRVYEMAGYTPNKPNPQTPSG